MTVSVIGNIDVHETSDNLILGMDGIIEFHSV